MDDSRGVSRSCPHCQADLQGQPIPSEQLKYYGSATHFGRAIGVEERGGHYDGALYWMCPECGGAWHRFVGPEMRGKAQSYIDEANSKIRLPRQRSLDLDGDPPIT